jgi:hypothetical protein
LGVSVDRASEASPVLQAGKALAPKMAKPRYEVPSAGLMFCKNAATNHRGRSSNKRSGFAIAMR